MSPNREEFDGAREGHTFDGFGQRLNARGMVIESKPISDRDWTDECTHCGKMVKLDRESECVHDRWFDFECPGNGYGAHEIS